jgi:predicted NUDIX family NTP pyrophosphohydrolase
LNSHKPKLSAGVLLYRTRDGVVEVLIAHPGGPFWARKDDGAWSIPKGEYSDREDPWAAAQRELFEELALPVPKGQRVDLGSVKQPSGKVVIAFAVHGDLDITDARSNTFEMEWPRGSGTMREFPEVDRVGWVAVAQARTKVLKGQHPFLDRLMAHPELAGLSEGT